MLTVMKLYTENMFSVLSLNQVKYCKKDVTYILKSKHVQNQTHPDIIKKISVWDWYGFQGAVSI